MTTRSEAKALVQRITEQHGFVEAEYYECFTTREARTKFERAMLAKDKLIGQAAVV